MISKLFPIDELSNTFKRFPIPIILSLLMYLMWVWISEKNLLLFSSDFFLVMGCFFNLFTMIKLSYEASTHHSKSSSRHILTNIALIGLLFMFLLPNSQVDIDPYWFILSFAFFILIPVVPYLNRTDKNDDLSFWLFSYKFFMVFGVFVLIFSLMNGIILLFFLLTDIFFKNRVFVMNIYDHINAFSFLLIFPIYLLNTIPKEFDYSEQELSYQSNLILKPKNSLSLLLLFIFILIIKLFEIYNTKGISNHYLLISSFLCTLFAIISYFLAWPSRHSDTLHIKFFQKIFFYSLIAPTIFYIYTIWIEVDIYGIREIEYFYILFAIWFSTIIITNIFKRSPLKYIPLSLAVLLILSTFGPWSADTISQTSQEKQLVALLQKNNMLQNDKIVPAQPSITFKDRKRITSVKDFLCGKHNQSSLRPYVDNPAKFCSDFSYRRKILGFPDVGLFEKEQKGNKKTPQANKFYLHKKQLEIILMKYDMLKDNKIQHSKKAVSYQDRNKINALIDTICRRNKNIFIDKWVDNPKEFCSSYSYRGKILGINKANLDEKSKKKSYERLSINTPTLFNSVKDFDYFMETYSLRDNKEVKLKIEGSHYISLLLKDNLVTITSNKNQKLQFDLSQFLKNTRPSPIIINNEKGQFKVRITVTGISGRKSNNEIIIDEIYINLALKGL